jgi:ribosomal protein L39E
MPSTNQKKIKLSVAGRQTKWAPFWVVIRKFGLGHKAHPSSITKHRRHWRQIKLKIKPRRTPKVHSG